MIWNPRHRVAKPFSQAHRYKGLERIGIGKQAVWQQSVYLLSSFIFLHFIEHTQRKAQKCAKRWVFQTAHTYKNHPPDQEATVAVLQRPPGSSSRATVPAPPSLVPVLPASKLWGLAASAVFTISRCALPRASTALCWALTNLLSVPSNCSAGPALLISRPLVCPLLGSNPNPESSLLFSYLLCQWLVDIPGYAKLQFQISLTVCLMPACTTVARHCRRERSHSLAEGVSMHNVGPLLAPSADKVMI